MFKRGKGGGKKLSKKERKLQQERAEKAELMRAEGLEVPSEPQPMMAAQGHERCVSHTKHCSIVHRHHCRFAYTSTCDQRQLLLPCKPLQLLRYK